MTRICRHGCRHSHRTCCSWSTAAGSRSGGGAGSTAIAPRCGCSTSPTKWTTQQGSLPCSITCSSTTPPRSIAIVTRTICRCVTTPRCTTAGTSRDPTTWASSAARIPHVNVSSRASPAAGCSAMSSVVRGRTRAYDACRSRRTCPHLARRTCIARQRSSSTSFAIDTISTSRA